MVDLARSPEQIGNAIRRARKKSGMSQSELGEKTGLRQGTISQIEKGHAAAKLENDFSCAVSAWLGVSNQRTLSKKFT